MTLGIIALLSIAAAAALRIGFVLVLIWGIIRLVDRWRTPLPAPVALTTPSVAVATQAPAYVAPSTETVVSTTTETKED
jgi:hypothetical protein